MVTPSDIPRAVYDNDYGNIMVGNFYNANNGATIYIGGKCRATHA
jgi:hypothetical protein